MKAKSDNFIIEIYFPTTKTIPFYFKSKDKIEDCVIVDNSNWTRLKLQMEHRNWLFKYLMHKYVTAGKKDNQNMGAFPSFHAYVEYKGFFAIGYMTTFKDDAKVIYGYNPELEVFLNETTTTFTKTNNLLYKEIALLYKSQEREYNFENKVGSGSNL